MQIDLPLPREGMITALRTLRFFPDDEVFSVLVNYFFHPDEEISRQALRSSAHRDNHQAVEHLLYIVESDETSRKLEALAALAAVESPESVAQLLNCYQTFSEPDLRAAVQQALIALDPSHKRVRELNRGILTQGSATGEQAVSAVRGLINAGDIDFLEHYLAHAPASVKRGALRAMLETRSELVGQYLKKLAEQGPLVGGEGTDEEAERGVLLAAYLLNSPQPQFQFVVESLASPRALSSFLEAVSGHIGLDLSPKNLFKLLVMLPVTESAVESGIEGLILRLLSSVKEISPGSAGELAAITSAHLEAVFRKVRKGFLSLKEVRSREELLPLVLSNLLQKYCPRPVLSRALVYFKEQQTDPRALIQQINGYLKSGVSSDIKGFRACLPLFTDPSWGKSIVGILRRIDPNMSSLLARLARLVRAAGELGMKDQEKKVHDIQQFAEVENVPVLERSAVEALCRLEARDLLDESISMLSHPPRNRDRLPGFIHGARYLPSELIAEPVVRLLQHPELTPGERESVVDTLCELDLSSSRQLPARVLEALQEQWFEPVQKERLAAVVAEQGGRELLGPLAELLDSDDELTRVLAVRMLRDIERNRADGDRAALVERLYALLEDGRVPVKVEALIALMALDDDYADEVAGDWLFSDDEILAASLVRRMVDVIGKSRLPLVAAALGVESTAVQEELRNLIASLSGATLEEQVRGMLIAKLSGTPGGAARRMSPEQRSGNGKQFLHAKHEFQLRREQSQELAVLFIDMVGYTERTSGSDMTNLMHLVKTFEEQVIPSLRGFNGQIVKKLGDGILAVFNHPANAVISCLEIMSKIGEYNAFTVDSDRFAVRAGVSFGQVMWRDGDVFGDVVNVAARIEASAGPGEILITDELYRKIDEYVVCEDRGELEVKGKKHRIRVHAPKGVVKNVAAILQVRNSNLASLLEEGGEQSLQSLREAFFAPRFDLPDDLSTGPSANQAGGRSAGQSGGQAEGQSAGPSANRAHHLLQGVFREIADAAGQLSRDSHQEFMFKKFLQQKWDETLERIRRGEG